MAHSRTLTTGLALAMGLTLISLDVEALEQTQNVSGDKGDWFRNYARPVCCIGSIGPGSDVCCSCTGTLIGPDLVLTAGHCGPFVGANVIFNYTNNTDTAGRSMASVIDVVASVDNDDEGLDYAILRVGRIFDGPGNGDFPGDVFGYLRMRAWHMAVNDKAHYTGHPNDNPWHSTSGHIEGTNANCNTTGVGCTWEINFSDRGCYCIENVESRSGMSGSGLMDDDGYVRGVLKGRSNELLLYDYVRGVPLHRIMRDNVALQEAIGRDAPSALGCIPFVLAGNGRTFIFYEHETSNNLLWLATNGGPWHQKDLTISYQCPSPINYKSMTGWVSYNPFVPEAQANGIIHMAYIGEGDRIIDNYGTSGTGWKSEDLTNELGIKANAIASWFNSTNMYQNIAVASVDGELYQLYYDGDHWKKRSISSALAAIPDLSSITDIVAWHTSKNIAHIAYVAADEIHDVYYSGKWKGPNVIVKAGKPIGNLRSLLSNGYLRLIYADESGHLWHNYYDGGSWQSTDITEASGARTVRSPTNGRNGEVVTWSSGSNTPVVIAYIDTYLAVRLLWYNGASKKWQSAKVTEDGKALYLSSSSARGSFSYVDLGGHVHWVARTSSSSLGMGAPTIQTDYGTLVDYNLSKRTGIPIGWEYDPIKGITKP